MNGVDLFTNPDTVYIGACVILGGVIVYQQLDRQKLLKKIEDLQDKLLTRADAYATKSEAMAEKTNTTISQLNELFKSGSRGA